METISLIFSMMALSVAMGCLVVVIVRKSPDEPEERALLFTVEKLLRSVTAVNLALMSEHDAVRAAVARELGKPESAGDDLGKIREAVREGVSASARVEEAEDEGAPIGVSMGEG
jgi:hypothetical protein